MTTATVAESVQDLVSEATQAGLLLYGWQGGLRVHGGETRPDLLARLKQNRDDVLEYLYDLICARTQWGENYHTNLSAALAETSIPQHVEWRFWELIGDVLGSYAWWDLSGMTPDQQREAEKFKAIPPEQLEEVRIKALAKWVAFAELREKHSWQMTKASPPAYAYSEEDGRVIGLALNPAWLQKRDELGGECFKWAWRVLLASVLGAEGGIEALDTKPWLGFLSRHVKRWEGE